MRGFLRDEFIRHTGIMVAGTGFVNLCNLLYHLAIVRLLTVPEYGVLNALVSLALVFSQFGATFRPALTRFLTVHFARGEADLARALLRRASRDLGLFSAVLLAAFVAGSGPLAGYQQIGSRSYIVLDGLFVALSTMAVIPLSFLWGSQRFARLACLDASSTFLKLAVGVGAVWFGMGVAGALAGYIVCPLFVLLAGLALIRLYGAAGAEAGRPSPHVSMAPVYRYFVPTAAALFSFTILTNIDVILVKHFFLPREAGYYSVAQMVGKIILFLPGAVSIVVFPKAASAREGEVESLPFLRKGLCIVGAACAAATAACALKPLAVLELLTGKTDPQSAALVPWFALAMSLYAMASLNIFYSLSVRNTRFVKYLSLLAVLQAAAICAWHPGLTAVVGLLTVFAALSFITTLLHAVRADPGGKREVTGG